jgi:hypothetical protein
MLKTCAARLVDVSWKLVATCDEGGGLVAVSKGARFPLGAHLNVLAGAEPLADLTPHPDPDAPLSAVSVAACAVAPNAAGRARTPETAHRAPSPLNGERARVRGEAIRAVGLQESEMRPWPGCRKKAACKRARRTKTAGHSA